jgi:hypothetical protein
MGASSGVLQEHLPRTAAFRGCCGRRTGVASPSSLCSGPGVEIVNLNGTGRRVVTEKCCQTATEFAWSHDGSRFAYADTALYVADGLVKRRSCAVSRGPFPRRLRRWPLKHAFRHFPQVTLPAIPRVGVRPVRAPLRQRTILLVPRRFGRRFLTASVCLVGRRFHRKLKPLFATAR